MITIPGNRVAIRPLYDSYKKDISTGFTTAELEYISNNMGIKELKKGGVIHIPEMAQERTDQGIVKYLGPRVRWCEIGMYVIFSSYAGTLTYVEGEGTLIIMKEEFVIAELADPPTVPIPGLFYRTRDGEYVGANYEDVIDHVGQVFAKEKWLPRVKTPKLSEDEIKLMGAPDATDE